MELIRIKSIDIINVKNVEKGHIEYDDFTLEEGNHHIIGIYGQNGSGKSSVITALRLVQRLMGGHTFFINNLYDFKPIIQVGKLFASVEVVFELINDDVKSFEVSYKAKVSTLDCLEESINYKNLQTGEKLNTLVDFDVTNKHNIFNPIARNKDFNLSKDTLVDFLVEKELARNQHTSLFFRNNFVENLLAKISDKSLVFIIQQLSAYAKERFFIIENSRNAQAIQSPLLPIGLNIFTESGDQMYTDNRFFDINIGNQQQINHVKESIEKLNIVMQSLVPGFSIEVSILNQALDQLGNQIYQYRLDGKRNNIQFPLSLESDGIKKIIGIVANLVRFYNDESSFVAIDELDSGVFEYLLGEALNVLNLGGAGQLLFTSHNLRPLEVLNKESIYFSTTNPQNRYIQFKHIKTNHNLRDFYYRTIQLGGQSEDIYQHTDQYRIREALLKANKK